MQKPDSKSPGDIKIALKVDVDTYVGTKEGVPRLIQFLTDNDIPASFYFSLGPDNSGKAIVRVFKKGFIKKMLRTKAPSMYGIRTMAYGTFLPAPMIGKRLGSLIGEVKGAGGGIFEVGLHAYDHVGWHDGLFRMSFDDIREELDRGRDEFHRIFGELPRAFAAPGWTVSREALLLLTAMDFDYLSATRIVGKGNGQWGIAFHPVMDGYRADIVEIPTTLPTTDELLGMGGRDIKGAFDFIAGSLNYGINVLTIHAESEGRVYFREFVGFVKGVIERGGSFLTLESVMKEHLGGKGLPEREVVMGKVPGRHGQVACLK